MTWLLLLACAAPADTGRAGEGEGEGESAETAETGEGSAAPALTSPAEAEDLDPDPAVVRVALRAAPHVHTLTDGAQTWEIEGYAYNGQTPGPTIRARVGDRVEVELTNGLPDATTIHWHGLHVPFAVDGVAWMMDPVGAGETMVYSFTVDRPGTFWYHPHFDSEAQVDMGLYGALIVEDPDEPVADDELVLVFDDWDLPGHGTPAGAEDDHGADGILGRWTINGRIDPDLTLTGGRSVRVRMLNVSNTGYLYLSWPDMRVIAHDQGLLPALEDEPTLLGPGDRLEAEWLPGEEGWTVQDLGYTQHGGATGDAIDLLPVAITSPAPAATGLDWPFSGALPTEDDGSTDLFYTLSGDTESGEWFINGEQWPDVTIAELPHGEAATIEVRNVSPTEHPFHLHGMPFEVLSHSGEAPLNQDVEDTVNVPLYGALRLRIVADNPGDWMTHCHILPHAEGGMMTVLRVSAADDAGMR